ncbi:hypothetical protein [Hymenobacter sp. BT491]|uniref:hypothetical protein n=1 Tax=Hymenobacter sp. BT491 TaxID=2766779 RepID=UPI001653AF85|nr:hypothetical protein [Hymenobacter sp. BT491]MBC6991328.1 hypothetical protein [Hymenobacter sp. BT491]
MDRVDSVYEAGYFSFRRTTPQAGSGTTVGGAFVVAGMWNEYLGPPASQGGAICYTLNLPVDVAMSPGQALTVGGQVYPHVVVLATPVTGGACPTYGLRTKATLRKLYYGQVWDRIP